MQSKNGLGILVDETIESVERAVLDERGDGSTCTDLIRITTKSGKRVYIGIDVADYENNYGILRVIPENKAVLMDEGRVNAVFYNESTLDPGFEPV